MASKPVIVSTVPNNALPVPPSINAISSHKAPAAGVYHKTRMRWTPELHERFVEAVNTLDGPESMFPLYPSWFHVAYCIPLPNVIK